MPIVFGFILLTKGDANTAKQQRIRISKLQGRDFNAIA
jgi:hypothetical protein